jgi:hypothetical protein
MRKYTLAVVFAALAVCVAVGASSAPALVKPRVFTLLEVEGTQQPLGDFDFDRAPAGGDQILASNTLYRWTGRKGIRVGRDRVLFTFMSGFGPNFSHRATVLFQAQAYLPTERSSSRDTALLRQTVRRSSNSRSSAALGSTPTPAGT